VFRAAAEVLRELEGRSERTFLSPREPLVNTAPPPLAPTSPEALLAAWRRFLLQRQDPELTIQLPGVARASVDERRRLVLERLYAEGRVGFRAVAGHSVDEVVATFLALLELFRRGVIGLEQAERFGELEISLLAHSA
jgi:segregation and condensation protein A